MTLQTLINKGWRDLQRDYGKPIINWTDEGAFTGRFISADGRHLVRLSQRKGSSVVFVHDLWASEPNRMYELETRTYGKDVKEVVSAIAQHLSGEDAA